MNFPFTPELLNLIRDNQHQGHRPLLFGNARIITTDPLIGDFERGDVLLGGSRIVGIGPGLLSAADDDGAIVIDCAGHVIVPGMIDIAQLIGTGPAGYRAPGAIVPGHPASFAVLPDVVGERAADILTRFLSAPSSARAGVVDGVVVRWDGKNVTPGAAPVQASAASPDAVPAHRLGTWIDENGFVHQHLSADGRYDETRGGREHAYQGSFWINGNRIDYRDDLGFWAFGEFTGDTLEHAGYTFHRA